MDIISFYRGLLKSTCIHDLNNDGFLTAVYKETETAVSVEGKRLVLPTDEILKGGNWDSRIAFHPLGEKINRGESPILKALKDYIYLVVNDVGWSIVTDLIKHASDEGSGPEEASYLRAVSGVDDTVVKAIKSVMNATSKDPNRRLISLYLKHGSTGKEGFARQCIVTFPIMDEFEHEESTIFGVKMSKKAKESIRKLLEYVLGDADLRKAYSVGSNNLEAPYFHALASSFYKLASRFNHLVDLHAKRLESPDQLRFDLSWAEYLDQLALFRGVIPTQPGNEGELLTGGKPDAVAAQANDIFDRKPAPAAPVAQQPVDVPWEREERRVGQSDRRVEPDRRHESPARPGTIGIEEFHAQWKREEPRRGGFFREEPRGFNRDFQRDDYGSHRQPSPGGFRNYQGGGRGGRSGGYL